MITERISRMQEYVNALNDAGARRTCFYPLAYESLKETRGQSVQMRRARAQAHILENAPLAVHPYELIVGSMTDFSPVNERVLTREEQRAKAHEVMDACRERKRGAGEAKKDRSTIKTFETEFTTRKSRWALMSRVYHDASITYAELQDLIAEMKRDYADADDLEPYEFGRELERAFKIDYGAEVKAEIDGLPWFAANHLSLNYGRIVQTGFGALIRDLEARRDRDGGEYYEAALLVARAASRLVSRYAGRVREEAQSADAARRAELLEIAAMLDHLSTGPARSFREGVQLMWLLHIMASFLWSSALSFGRFDQYMYGLYAADIASGALTREAAEELLCCLWLKINEPCLRTVQSMTLGGVTPAGEDAANPLTYLCLDVVEEMKLPYPNVGVRINDKNPPELLTRVTKSISAGAGQPMVMADNVWIANLKKLGYADRYANDYYNMGCVEIMIPGKMQNWGVTEPIAFPMLYDTLFARLRRGEVRADTFEEFERAYLDVLREEVAADYQEALDKIADKPRRCYDPFASLMIDGCIEAGKDMFQGGSELGTHWCFYAYGLGTAADAMAAVKKHVYEDGRLTIGEMDDVLARDFAGDEALRLRLENKTPHYGNDDPYVDGLAKRILSAFDDQVFACNDPQKPDKFVNTLFGYFFHIYHGEITGATPNGRHKGETFSDSMGPSQGKDTQGPTKMLGTILALDHSAVTGGYALNVKINPTLVKNDEGRKALRTLIDGYISDGGPQVQFNFVDAETLKKAKQEPRKYRNLIVRIGGYCEYFVNLDSALQDEIITRTVHGL